ncbi:MAG: glucose 1-dehydrogenase [Gammaproteobacteria bacterium]|nr:glucose 1-dehydrogenase [Gammaproteobacteria bacterium]
MFNLRERVYIITGSSRGIGLATATALAAQGAAVVISSRKQEACDAVAQRLRSDGAKVLAQACHIGKHEDLQQLIDKTITEFGRLDGLVCNAASNPVYGPLAELDQQAFDLIMRNNLYSQIELTRMAAAHLQASGHGAIVLVSSVAGLSGQTNLGAYAISKAGEMQLARNLALEYSRKQIRVNSVAPGLIRTDFSQALLADADKVRQLERQLPSGRIGEPEDIAGVIAFLLSDAAAYVNGQTIVADGGMLIAQSL